MVSESPLCKRPYYNFQRCAGELPQSQTLNRHTSSSCNRPLTSVEPRQDFSKTETNQRCHVDALELSRKVRENSSVRALANKVVTHLCGRSLNRIALTLDLALGLSSRRPRLRINLFLPRWQLSTATGRAVCGPIGKRRRLFLLGNSEQVEPKCLK